MPNENLLPDFLDAVRRILDQLDGWELAKELREKFEVFQQATKFQPRLKLEDLRTPITSNGDPLSILLDVVHRILVDFEYGGDVDPWDDLGVELREKYERYQQWLGSMHEGEQMTDKKRNGPYIGPIQPLYDVKTGRELSMGTQLIGRFSEGEFAPESMALVPIPYHGRCLTCRHWCGDVEAQLKGIEENSKCMDLDHGWPLDAKCAVIPYEINIHGNARADVTFPANFGCILWAQREQKEKP